MSLWLYCLRRNVPPAAWSTVNSEFSESMRKSSKIMTGSSNTHFFKSKEVTPMLKLSRYDDFGKLIVRLMVGVLILFHGVHKILNPGSLDSIRKMLISANLPSLLAYGVYLGEIVGALMVILGAYSRIGGLLIAGNMLFALGLAHRAQVFSLTNTGGWSLELQAFFLLSGLAIIFLGSGRLALKPD
jgi:putative oxidoreductase